MSDLEVVDNAILYCSYELLGKGCNGVGGSLHGNAVSLRHYCLLVLLCIAMMKHETACMYYGALTMSAQRFEWMYCNLLYVLQVRGLAE